MFWISLLSIVILLSMIVNPSGYGYIRVSSSCTVSSYKRERIDTSGWRYDMSFHIHNSSIYIGVTRICNDEDDTCIYRYNTLFPVGTMHVCRYYLEDPSLSPLIDDEYDPFPLYVFFLLVVSICVCASVCICISIMRFISDKYEYAVSGYQSL
jgi:hypothetical protein